MRQGLPTVRRELEFSYTLQKQVKSNYECATSVEKTTISKILAGNVIKKYQYLGELSYVVSIKRYRKNCSEPGFVVKKQIKNWTGREQLKKEIVDFFHRDNITTQSPNKNDTLTFQKKKELKRYFNDTLPSLFKIFIEKSNKKISFPTFLKYKPYYVVHLKCNARNTCACIKHLNLQLKIDRLRELKIIGSKNLSELMSSMTCDNKRNEKCMLRLCKKCRGKKLPILESGTKDETYFYEWIRFEEKRVNKQGKKYIFKAMSKQKITATSEEIINKIETLIPEFLLHLLNNHNQHDCSEK